MSETVSQLLALPEQGSVGMRWSCGFRMLLRPVVLVTVLAIVARVGVVEGEKHGGKDLRA